ncbi:MAG: Ig-like domain-containing protein [Thermoplasmata archaeon]|nr:MAG: Ig-like domain-containing protein [Thermoplasmata archaeon]
MNKVLRVTTIMILVFILLSSWGFATSKVAAHSTSMSSSARAEQNSHELTLSDVDNLTVVWENKVAHENNVWMVRWNPNGTYFVSVDFDGKIIIWNGSTSEQILAIPNAHVDYIRCVAWSTNGSLLATGSEGGLVRIWDALTGKRIRSLEDQSLLPEEIAHDGPVVALSWSLDGRFLATASGDDALPIAEGDNEIKLWEAATGVKNRTVTKFVYKAMDVAFSPVDPDILAVAGDTELRVYNITTGEKLQSFPTNGTAHCVSWSPNGTLLGAGTRNFTVHIFHADSGSEIDSYLDLDFKRREIAWSPEGKYIAEAGSGEVIKIRSVFNGTIMKILYGTSSRCSGNFLPSISWSSKGKYLVTGTAGIYSVVVFGDKKFDYAPPRITSYSPTGISVPKDAAISVKFNEPINYDLFSEAFKYTDGVITWSAEDGDIVQFGLEFVFYPAQKLPVNTTIVVSIDTELKDPAGNRIMGTNFWTFRTAENTVPVLSNSRIEPQEGDARTNFSFIIHYLDLDGDKPARIYAVIDDRMYEMSFLNGSRDNGYYRLQQKLPEGTHSYYFTASDGMADAIGSAAGKQHSNELQVSAVKDEDDDDTNWALRADLIGGIIVVILILGWFKLVLRRSETKK